MIIQIAEKDKAKLNLIIAYYRRLFEITNDAFTMKNFVIDKYGTPICSITTLSRLENNKIESYDSTYFSLLDKLQMKYYSDPKIDVILHEANLAILQHAEFNHAKAIIDLIQNIFTHYGKYRNYAIYHEQFDVYDIVMDYYAHYQFNPDIIDKMNELIELVDDCLRPILIEITFIYYTRINMNGQEALNTLEKVKYCHTNSIIKEYVDLLLSYRKYELTAIKSKGESLITRCNNENNKFYLCKAYNILSVIYTVQNPKKAAEYLHESIQHFDHQYDIPQNLCVYHKNLAITACCNLEDYELALKHFEACFQLDEQILIITFPYYLFALEKVNLFTKKIKNTLLVLKNNEEKIETLTFIHIYHLFCIKYLNEKINHKLVIKELIKIKDIIKNVPPLFRIIDTEIHDICILKKDLKTYSDYVNNFH